MGGEEYPPIREKSWVSGRRGRPERTATGFPRPEDRGNGRPRHPTTSIRLYRLGLEITHPGWLRWFQWWSLTLPRGDHQRCKDQQGQQNADQNRAHAVLDFRVRLTSGLEMVHSIEARAGDAGRGIQPRRFTPTCRPRGPTLRPAPCSPRLRRMPGAMRRERRKRRLIGKPAKTRPGRLPS